MRAPRGAPRSPDRGLCTPGAPGQQGRYALRFAPGLFPSGNKLQWYVIFSLPVDLHFLWKEILMHSPETQPRLLPSQGWNEATVPREPSLRGFAGGPVSPIVFWLSQRAPLGSFCFESYPRRICRALPAVEETEEDQFAVSRVSLCYHRFSLCYHIC